MRKEEDNLSIEHFRKWIKQQEQFDSKIEKKYPLGIQVESKINSKKLSNLMTLENGQMGRVIKDFMKNGGKIAEVDGDNFLIEATMGSFYIKKNYVRRA
jgi:hypothetical protein